jgi:hypothetical protein
MELLSHDFFLGLSVHSLRGTTRLAKLSTPPKPPLGSVGAVHFSFRRVRILTLVFALFAFRYSWRLIPIRCFNENTNPAPFYPETLSVAESKEGAA